MATPKRRWHQFSLLALLILITVISAPLGWLAYERNKVQRRDAADGPAVDPLAGKEVFEL